MAPVLESVAEEEEPGEAQGDAEAAAQEPHVPHRSRRQPEVPEEGDLAVQAPAETSPGGPG